jgi:hypothetical protein
MLVLNTNIPNMEQLYREAHLELFVKLPKAAQDKVLAATPVEAPADKEVMTFVREVIALAEERADKITAQPIDNIANPS